MTKSSILIKKYSLMGYIKYMCIIIGMITLIDFVGNTGFKTLNISYILEISLGDLFMYIGMAVFVVQLFRYIDIGKYEKGYDRERLISIFIILSTVIVSCILGNYICFSIKAYNLLIICIATYYIINTYNNLKFKQR
ncbi:hypothetical protein IZY60_06740 [Lutibacter sp. B2]|nr:hypothetical protein [Lutibacter sp. B2]